MPVKDKCGVTPLSPLTCKPEVAKSTDTNGECHSKEQGEEGTGNSVDTEFPSGKMKTNASSLLPAYSPVVLCCTLKMCKGRLV